MKLTPDKFAKSFQVSVEEFSSGLKDLIQESNIELEPIEGLDRENLLLEILGRIKTDTQVIASAERTKVWMDGWNENLEAFLNSGGNVTTLVPKFIRANIDNPELKYIEILRRFVFEKYFAKISKLYEFGAGTGFNLVHASEVLKDVKLVGTDFVQSSVDLMTAVAKTLTIPLESQIFDMRTPSRSDLEIEPNSGVFTFGSLEQLGGELSPMINYLLVNSPSVCVHIEPVVELYDLSILEDFLASWFQSKRGYSSGLLEILEELEEENRLEVICTTRLNFGSKMLEGYNLIVWRPLN